MGAMTTVITQPEGKLTTYTFKVVVEPDEDAWHAYCPALVRQGGATWGKTREEALAHIEEVVRMVVESLREHGEPVPEGPADQVQVSAEPVVAVTV
jgi:predicted RNase H-like HicB family nuclease